MSTTVNVWPKRGGNVGHASVEVSGPAGECYISWWPEFDDKEAKGGEKKSVFWGVTGARYTYRDDVGGEGRVPDHRIILGKLDEGAIVDWWATIKPHYWSLLNTNCSQVAADALRAGGANQFLYGLDYAWTSWNVVWRPSRVLELALAIQRGEEQA